MPQPDPPSGDPPPTLEIIQLSLLLGGVRALTSVDMVVESRMIVGLVGPNGAGKTSLFNCVCGYYPATSGWIRVAGTDVTRCKPHELPRHGVARTFQHPILDPSSTVMENVLVGGHGGIRSGPLSYALRLPWAIRDERRTTRAARDLLDYLEIGHQANLRAGELSYGEQKRVELARALLTGPTLLLLDELASGLTHEEVMALATVIRRIRDDHGISVLLVEHHMGMISAITDKVVALVEGVKVAEGTAAQVQLDPAVVEAYLGAA
ncbi:ABC transporter ATP-binding protein [Streptosporangium sp. CA-135522]|uniref:ABC transporter ATP-binding protein n=1 Tax=Streptosporangium sp. CA-135522 TaxID=3240072 RepID=UPI003D8E4DB2